MDWTKQCSADWKLSYSSGTTGMYPTSYLDGDGPMLVGAGKMSEMSSPDQKIGVPP